jgi:sterol desaturase/sphingolipid hydroxylase (fatty acid hydroxylase superfamily)
MLNQILQVLRETFFWALITFGAGTAIELLIPGERQSWRSRAKGLTFWLIYTGAAFLTATPLTLLYQHAAIKPLLFVSLRTEANAGNLLAIIPVYLLGPYLFWFVFDFFYYWLHRSQHAFGKLWRLHSVHHSIEELNIVNSFHHVTEPVVQVAFALVPAIFLIGIDYPFVMAMAVLFRVQMSLIHANCRLRYGPLKYVFAEPIYHRIHHSIEKQHWDKNFAAFFPVWDVIFGTAYFPKKGEYPKTGLSNQREPRSVGEYVMAPFRKPLGDFETVEQAKAACQVEWDTYKTNLPPTPKGEG